MGLTKFNWKKSTDQQNNKEIIFPFKVLEWKAIVTNLL